MTALLPLLMAAYPQLQGGFQRLLFLIAFAWYGNATRLLTH